jgi:AraC family transcriptional regulator
MILTTLPDLPPRPETQANAEARRRFYARWGHENAIVCGHAERAEYAVHPQTLSVKVAEGGRERYFLARREVVVDPDNYLVLNEGARYGSVLEGEGPPRRSGAPRAWSFSIFFRPGMQGEVAAERQRTLAAALDAPAAAPATTVEFAEHLRSRGDAVSGVLQHIARRVQEHAAAGAVGNAEEGWLEESLTILLEAMLAAEATHRPQADGAAAPRAAQRAELRRRLAEAADFIESHHAAPLTLEQMAGVACLSRYHFVREFGRAYGLAPHAWLTRKRARAARRWIAAGATDLDWVAQRCGLGSRWSLRRALARLDAIEPPR